MEITEAQYERIKDALPVQRGNVRLSNLQVLNAVLYVAEQGCKWRGLPKRFGRWHTIYTRMNRWSKNGVLDQVFEKLQSEQIVRITIEVVPPKSKRIEAWEYDRALYKKRNEIERLFRRLKGFRRIFSRFEKLDVLFLGFLNFALIIEALR